jgi:hypothetical protein
MAKLDLFVFVFLIVSILAFLWLKRTRLKRESIAAVDQLRAARQDQLLTIISKLEPLYANTELSADQLKAASDELFLQMEAINFDGYDDALIADVKAYTAGEVSKRRIT